MSQLGRYHARMLYIGLDIHQETTVISVRSHDGLVVKREVVPTTRLALRRFFALLRSQVRIAMEAGPMASYVASLLKSKRREVVICEGRRNRLILHGSKSDRVDADKLSELLRLGALRPVFQGDEATETLRRLSHHYLRLVADRCRVVQRLRSFLARMGLSFTRRTFSPQAVPLRSIRSKSDLLIIRSLLRHVNVLTPLVTDARSALISEASTHSEFSLLQSMPFVGPIRAAQLIAAVGTPHRFKSVRQFWAYAGLAVERRISAEHRVEKGRAVRAKRRSTSCRLNRNYHPRVKKVMKDIALGASLGGGALRLIYDRHPEKGKRPAIARVALARRVATILFAMWKSGSCYNAAQITT
jgi:transposase